MTRQRPRPMTGDGVPFVLGELLYAGSRAIETSPETHALEWDDDFGFWVFSRRGSSVKHPLTMFDASPKSRAVYESMGA